MGAALVLGLVVGCREPSSEGGSSGPAASAATTSEEAPRVIEVTKPEEKKHFAPGRAGCDAVDVLVAGESAGSICIDDAAKAGLTVIDLSDGWTPRVFAPDKATGEAPEYRAKYLELASQPTIDLGLYGVAPTMTVLAARLTDEAKRTCDAAVDRAPLEALAKSIAAPDTKAKHAPPPKEAVAAAQAELTCDGLLKKRPFPGSFDGTTQMALDAFRRRHLIVGAGLDGDTVRALAKGGDELAFVGLLRGLRERVADAAALLEDGSASEQKALVADREIDLFRFAPERREALPNGAPDRIGQAADAAARALGWTSPDKARAFLAARGKDGLKSYKVAVELPAAPAYATASMDLRVEIDRGDVFPGAAMRGPQERHAPTYVLYAKDGGKEIPLVRWATTIGGWKKERTPEGEIITKYKESDVGDRMYRQIIAAPAWMPPESTPETDLLHEGKDGSVALKRDLIQPGYRNAYGLVMLIHDKPVTKGTETTWVDRGIRTHGSVDYRSIQRGSSHGCHRLYNQLVLRLSGYLLAHRPSIRRGKMQVGYHRTLSYNGENVDVDVATRGYQFELDPPVPVKVLEGNVAPDPDKPVATDVAAAGSTRG